jgi:hypothetical protein
VGLQLVALRMGPFEGVHTGPSPNQVESAGAAMQRFGTNGSVGLPDHSLCPDKGLPKKRSQTLSHGYPTLRFPSLFDCVVHFFDQIRHFAFVDDAIFHGCCSLHCPHSTLSAPHGHRGINRNSEYCYGIASLRFVMGGEGSSLFLGECSCWWHDGWERLRRSIFVGAIETISQYSFSGDRIWLRLNLK